MKKVENLEKLLNDLELFCQSRREDVLFTKTFLAENSSNLTPEIIKEKLDSMEAIETILCVVVVEHFGK